MHKITCSIIVTNADNVNAKNPERANGQEAKFLELPKAGDDFCILDLKSMKVHSYVVDYVRKNFTLIRVSESESRIEETTPIVLCTHKGAFEVDETHAVFGFHVKEKNKEDKAKKESELNSGLKPKPEKKIDDIGVNFYKSKGHPNYPKYPNEY